MQNLNVLTLKYLEIMILTFIEPYVCILMYVMKKCKNNENAYLANQLHECEK
jgi:hypothetical protein